MNNEVLPEMNVSEDKNAVELSCNICEEVLTGECVLEGVSDNNQHEIEFSCIESEVVLSDECISDIKNKIELSNGLSDEVLSDECAL